MSCDLLQMQISALLNRKGSGEGAVLELLHRFTLHQVSAKSSDPVHVRVPLPIGITCPIISFYPLGLKKHVFSHQFILCGLSYKNAPAGFSI